MEIYLKDKEEWVSLDSVNINELSNILRSFYFKTQSEDEFTFIRNGDLIGYINNKFEIVVEPSFKKARMFTQVAAAACNEDGWYVGIRQYSRFFKERIVEDLTEDDEIFDFVNDYAVFKTCIEDDNNNWLGFYGIVSCEAIVVVPAKYRSIKLINGSQSVFCLDDGKKLSFFCTMSGFHSYGFDSIDVKNDMLVMGVTYTVLDSWQEIDADRKQVYTDCIYGENKVNYYYFLNNSWVEIDELKYEEILCSINKTSDNDDSVF